MEEIHHLKYIYSLFKINFIQKPYKIYIEKINVFFATSQEYVYIYFTHSR